MSHETSKAINRLTLTQDTLYQEALDAGEMWLDVGGGDDCHPRAQRYDIQDGDAQTLLGVPDDKYDVLWSSHCLEHLRLPHVAVRRWIEVVRPGGFLWIIVPDFWLYEHGLWPSKFNGDHKHAFLTRRGPRTPTDIPDVMIFLENFAAQFGRHTAVRRLERADSGYDYKRLRDATYDQTLHGAEAAIELVLQKL